MARRASAGAPARLALLLLAALVAGIACVAAAPAACPISPNGTSTICVGCPRKSCKFDDNCHLNKAGQARKGICQDLGSGLIVGPTDMCSGVQRKHGKNAPADVGGPGKKKARCNAKSVTKPGYTTSGCQCVNKQGNNLNKKGNPVKKCKRCQQKEALRPNPNVSPPPPPNPNVSPPPPPPGPNFLEDNVMSMQYGAVEYTPSSPNGNWTSLCQIAAQARSVGYAADRPGSELGDSTIPNFAYLRDLWEGEVDVPDIGALYKNNQTTYPTDFMNNPASYMAGTKYFDAASQWYPSLQQNGGSGANTDFLSDYFFSAMQTKLGLTDEGEVDWSTALSGSKTISANQQILEKSSTYFVATTHAMYYLQLAEEAIAKNDTAGAKNHFDSIAAVYFGCGDTNPVPLPVYTPDSVVTTAPQVPTQIPWTKDSDKEDGDRGTVYSLYNLANKRASNYGRCGSSQSGSCATDVASKTAGTVTVADLNLVVADALNYGTSGPSAAAVNNIRDSINTINAQAAQRYIARVSLDANVPGNGFGGSTQRVKVASPAASEDAAAGNGLIPTACGGGLYYQAFAGLAGGEGGDNDAGPAGAGEVPAGILPGATYTKYSGTILAVKPTDEDLESYNKAPSTFGTSGGPLVNAQCGTSANSTGTVGSNTLMVGSVMNPVTVKDDASAPYQLKGTAVTDPVEAGEAGSIAVTANEVTAALRGQTEFVTTVDFYKKKTPIGCIGRDVRFSDIEVTIDSSKKMVYTFCDPSGYKGASLATNTLATNTQLYDVNMKATGSAATAGSYFATVFGTGTTNVPDTTAAITVAQAKQMSRVWDPVMAAQLTQGGMCCDALYYGNEGVGRPTIEGVGPVSDYEPPLAGGDMAAESPVGTMCPMHGSGNGYSTSTVGNVNQVNPSETLLLEGQAFYVSLAPSQYSLPLTSTTAETQTANEAKQKQCATHITSMMKMSKAVAVESSGTPPSFTGTLSTGTPGKFGYDYSAIDFPLWKVGIGSADPVNQYIVPNGYCYANACFNDFAEVGTQPTFKGAEKLGELVQGPNMALVEADEACGRANAACAAPPATWNGAPAVMAACYGSNCTPEGILATTGVIPVA